jgi:hypothetical protein
VVNGRIAAGPASAGRLAVVHEKSVVVLAAAAHRFAQLLEAGSGTPSGDPASLRDWLQSPRSRHPLRRHYWWQRRQEQEVQASPVYSGPTGTWTASLGEEAAWEQSCRNQTNSANASASV